MRLSFSRFAVPLRSPGLLGPDVRAREGFLVEVRDADGLVGRGEASPAYWIDPCDLGRLADELGSVAARPLPEGGPLDEEAYGHGLPRLSPAARCGIETALLDLAARRRRCSVAELLGAVLPVTIPVSALVGGADAGEVREQAIERLRDGHRVLKLKVGGYGPETDIERIRAVRSASGGSARLRLDANRSWDVATALRVLGEVAGPDLSMVEEPLRGSRPLELARLRRATGVPVALDESIVDETDLAAHADGGSCDAVVIKLARVGGPRAGLALAHRARALGLGVVWTDSIETGTGRRATLHAAAAAPGPCEAVGLGGAVLLDGPRGDGAGALVEVHGPGLG